MSNNATAIERAVLDELDHVITGLAEEGHLELVVRDSEELLREVEDGSLSAQHLRELARLLELHGRTPANFLEDGNTPGLSSAISGIIKQAQSKHGSAEEVNRAMAERRERDRSARADYMEKRGNEEFADADVAAAAELVSLILASDPASLVTLLEYLAAFTEKHPADRQRFNSNVLAISNALTAT
ncbi:hypothetical protein [Devosia sp. RR2S18]|uniref:hypothetical protein n=1 Tax=Devosia rhizosphaerae TaxID=3049774 RepID=UPI002540B849|nr:hypothetical protein [Devosia sp. RR2S18]WIJ24220.1 hypothetical protein QOV41_14525 [Devosia sp. RR2S18]